MSDKEIAEIIIIISGVLLICLLGIFLFLGARWSRRKNEEINQDFKISQVKATQKALEEGKMPCTSKEFWHADIPQPHATVGKVLAIFIIMVFSAFLLFAGLVVIKLI